MGSRGRRTAERRVKKTKNRVRKQLAPWMSVKVMFYKIKESQILWLKKSSKTKKQQERARKYFMFKMNQLRER